MLPIVRSLPYSHYLERFGAPSNEVPIDNHSERSNVDVPEKNTMAHVLITGSRSGIGFATALAFARAGHKVAATMRNADAGSDLADTAVREKLAITVFSMDVDSDSSVGEGIDGIVKNGGPIDVLVNNAGIERTGSVEELPLSEFRAVM